MLYLAMTVAQGGGAGRVADLEGGAEPHPSQAAVARAEWLARLATGCRGPSPLNWSDEVPLGTGMRHLASALRPGARVLNLGCGTSGLTAALAAAGLESVGIDIHRESLRRAPAGRRPTVPHYVAADLCALPFDDGSFDAVVSVSVLQYLDWRRGLQGLRRVLKPGGKALFIENLRGNPLARGYRVARRTVLPYPKHLIPRKHLGWSEVSAFDSVFVRTERRVHGLLSPLALLRHALHHALGDPTSSAGSPLERTCFDALETLDHRLLDRWPGLANLAWLVSIKCWRD
jgi:SAM-dependent methyltransferase